MLLLLETLGGVVGVHLPLPHTLYYDVHFYETKWFNTHSLYILCKPISHLIPFSTLTYGLPAFWTEVPYLTSSCYNSSKLLNKHHWRGMNTFSFTHNNIVESFFHFLFPYSFLEKTKNHFTLSKWMTHGPSHSHVCSMASMWFQSTLGIILVVCGV